MTSEPTITVPNLSASRLYSDLQNLHHESLNWQCNLFFDDEINEQTGKPTMKHDLCEVLAREWPFKFPAKYRGLASRTQLVVDLKIAAIQCGFCLFTRNSSANPIDGEVQVHPKTNSMRQAHVSLYCEQGQLHRPMNEQERNAASSADSSVDSEESAGASGCQKYNTSTKKPTEPDYVCPFRLNIYMVSEDAPVDAGRWFVSHINVNKRTCAWHRGHIRLRPSELHNYLTNMSEEDPFHSSITCTEGSGFLSRIRSIKTRTSSDIPRHF
ncbi:hypothetical protein IV203_030094 [Nitzschia inconspicua]|uniref:Uncharacterized protein n=1 Tax=Nitzschia inconspicua TaxID=303405 RepID=A0A9K3Q1D0_9STRA|nr:hypothetical protein IV203_030094 [Nitzschia inconspicua]